MHRKYLTLAKQAEDRADARKRAIRHVVQRDLSIKFSAQEKFWKGRDFDQEVEFNTSKQCQADPAWKTQVALNQWYIAQATMYGTAATTDLLERLLKAIEGRG